MNEIDKMNATELPAQNEFDSLLRNERCSADDYARAQRVWERYECETFKDYHELYLKCIEFFLFALTFNYNLLVKFISQRYPWNSTDTKYFVSNLIVF